MGATAETPAPETPKAGTVMETPSPEPTTPEAKPEGTPEGKPEGSTDTPTTEKADESKETEDKDGKAAAKPEVPEKYELTAGENSPFTADHLELFATEARALGLSQEQAQNMVVHREAALAEQRERFFEDLQADPEIGGKNLDATVALAVKGRDFLWPPNTPEAEVMQRVFQDGGYGNHKVLVRAFARLGKLLAEDSLDSSGSGGGGREKSEVERIYGSETANVS